MKIKRNKKHSGNKCLWQECNCLFLLSYHRIQHANTFWRHMVNLSSKKSGKQFLDILHFIPKIHFFAVFSSICLEKYSICFVLPKKTHIKEYALDICLPSVISLISAFVISVYESLSSFRYSASKMFQKWVKYHKYTRGSQSRWEKWRMTVKNMN